MRLESTAPEAPHWSRAVYEGFFAADVRRKRIFVAEDGGSVIGFAAAQIVLDVCELDSIVVSITTRRNGVGRALLTALFDWAISGESSRVQLEVRSGNSRAIDFYRAAGFAQDGLRPGYYCDPLEDAVLMSRTLP